MRITLEQRGSRALLRGVGKTLTPEALLRLLLNKGGKPGDPGSPSFDPRLVEDGGEAWIRLCGSTALRFDRKLMSPDTTAAERARYLDRLQAISGVLPNEAVAPQLALYVEGYPEVLGHTMEYVEDLSLFNDAAASWCGHEATSALRALHCFMKECHERGVVLGEVNPRNFGYGRRGFVALDTLTYEIPGFTCDTIYRPTVDPTLISQDEALSDHDARAWTSERSHSVSSDWYSFACIALEVLTGVGPWAGTHRFASQSPELRRMRVRALRGISIFDPAVELHGAALHRSPEALREPLYNYLYGVFAMRQRGVFPEQLLSEAKWLRCSTCSAEYMSASCPCGARR